MARLRYRQIILFFVVLILPSLAIITATRTINDQARKLAFEDMERRAIQEQERAAAEIGQDMFARLEVVKYREIARAQTAIPQADAESDSVVALTGWVKGDRLVWPWNLDPSGEQATPFKEDPTFAQKMRDAARVEFAQKEQAAILYRALAADAQDDSQRGLADLSLARTLAQSGAPEDARRVYMDLLNLPWNVTDEFGFPIASYAALRLVRIGAGREVIERVKRDLESATAVSLNQAYRLRSILEGLKGSADPALHQYVASAQARVVARIEYLEEKSRVDEAQSLQRNWNALGVTPAVWRSYEGPNHELWLVSRAPDGPNSPPVALAVRAEVIRRAVASDRASRSARERFEIANIGPAGRSLGEHLPDLHVTFSAANGIQASSPPPLPLSRLWLWLVVPLTLLGGLLLWRDTRRESRTAEMRSQFVSSVSHELKTPLTSIRMFAETLQMADETNASDPQIRAEYLDTIVSEAERLTRLLNNVLDFSRIERDQKTYHLESAHLANVVDAAVRTMRFPLSEQGFRLDVNVSRELPSLQIDRDAMEQAILNLLSNAMKYSGKSRDIALRVNRQNGSAVIQVSDHGIGIPAAEQRRIFDRFYRVPSKENRSISGTGLGLALVAHVAEAHGGTVDVQSEPGAGSTFSIRIPVNGSNGA